MFDKNSKIYDFFNNYFPPITEENIIRRTFIFYGMLFLFLFSIPIVQKNLSLLTFGILSISLFFLVVNVLSFITSKNIPNFLLLFTYFKGFKLFMFIYVIYLMITLLSTLYFPNKTEFLGNLYIIGFAVFPIIIFFYYILRLIRTVKLKFTKEKI